ncbi:hypothetical protein CH063_07558 [Colletotrichum higginsianum]|uniref:Uncharacterized protein n=1 Tax=Colletotrichum higginsianum (strain IMI 349063) TaxID=759273 RepID=H1V6L0_COLHI|nr:hypothetical protein CH063_07558 [Colletotrichum higginsianum]
MYSALSGMDNRWLLPLPGAWHESSSSETYVLIFLDGHHPPMTSWQKRLRSTFSLVTHSGHRNSLASDEYEPTLGRGSIDDAHDTISAPRQHKLVQHPPTVQLLWRRTRSCSAVFSLSHFTKTSPGPIEWGVNDAASTTDPSIVRILRTPSSDYASDPAPAVVPIMARGRG